MKRLEPTSTRSAHTAFGAFRHLGVCFDELSQVQVVLGSDTVQRLFAPVTAEGLARVDLSLMDTCVEHRLHYDGRSFCAAAS